MDRKYLREPEAAHRIGLAAATLKRWRSRRVGPPYHVISRGAVVYSTADLDHWMDSRRRETDAETGTEVDR